ncbi:MAG TPA: hypothetical protein ENG68_03035 [bacterium]|nr:hypothetical protein [bacterium]
MVTRFFRKKRNLRIIMWITAILIIPGFLIWGVGIGGGSRTKYLAAIVNGQPISLREYYMALDRVEERYREIFGDKFDQIIKKENLQRSVLEELIREKILTQQARKRRIKVFDSEIVEAVKSMDIFKDKNGKFDEEKFRRIIRNMPVEEVRKLEEDARKAILFQKLKERVISEGKVDVSDKEVNDYMEKNKIPEKEKERVRMMLLWMKRENFFNNWYNDLRRKSKIQIFINFEEK